MYKPIFFKRNLCAGVAQQVGSVVQENLDIEGGEIVGGMLKEGLEAGLKTVEGGAEAGAEIVGGLMKAGLEASVGDGEVVGGLMKAGLEASVGDGEVVGGLMKTGLSAGLKAGKKLKAVKKKRRDDSSSDSSDSDDEMKGALKGRLKAGLKIGTIGTIRYRSTIPKHIYVQFRIVDLTKYSQIHPES